jgi:hypothetical protein
MEGKSEDLYIQREIGGLKRVCRLVFSIFEREMEDATRPWMRGTP